MIGYFFLHVSQDTLTISEHHVRKHHAPIGRTIYYADVYTGSIEEINGMYTSDVFWLFFNDGPQKVFTRN